MVSNIIFLGAALAFILGTGQLLSEQARYRNYLAAALLYCLGIIHLITFGQTTGFISLEPWVVAVNLIFFTLLGPLFYLYFMRILDPRLKITRSTALLFLPTAISLMMLIPYLSLSEEERAASQQLLASGEEPLWSTFPNNLVVLIFLATQVYILYPLKTIFHFIRDGLLLNKPAFLVALGFICCFSINIWCVIFFQFYDINALKMGVAVFFTCWIVAIYLVSQRYPEFLTNVSADIVDAKYQKSQLGRLNVEQVVNRLNQLMEKERVYLEEDLSLPKLAEKLAITPHQLSEILNHKLRTSFKSYLKTIRIDAAKKILLKNPEQTALTVSMEVGFRSYSTFNSAFKQDTGLSPVEYRKKHL